jgi:hypothetical protein
MQIFVKTLTGKTITLEVSYTELTVGGMRTAPATRNHPLQPQPRMLTNMSGRVIRHHR